MLNVHHRCHHQHQIIIIIARPKTAYGRQGLGWDPRAKIQFEVRERKPLLPSAGRWPSDDDHDDDHDDLMMVIMLTILIITIMIIGGKWFDPGQCVFI